MKTLLPEDLNHVVNRLPRDLQKLLKENPGKLFLAGGAIRAIIAGERISDYDILGPDKNHLKELAILLSMKRTNGKLWKTKNAYTVLAFGRAPVQFIHRWLFSNAMELVLSFDFTIAQAVVWYGKFPDTEALGWKSLCSDSFYTDLAAKRLRYTFPQRHEDAGGSLMRVRKFLKNGYQILAPSLAGVIARLMKSVDISIWTEGHGGDELALAKILTGLLREVDPLNVVDGVEIEDGVPVAELTEDETADKTDNSEA